VFEFASPKEHPEFIVYAVPTEYREIAHKYIKQSLKHIYHNGSMKLCESGFFPQPAGGVSEQDGGGQPATRPESK
jgi:hypothetical protein